MRAIMLSIHFIGMAMFIGTGFAYLFLEIANNKLEKNERIKFSLSILPLSKMGHIGLLLLIVSGGYLMSPFWPALSQLPLLITKLSLVVLLSVIIGVMAWYSKKARQGNAEQNLKKVEPFSSVAFILGLIIIVLAVLVFQ